MNTINFVLMESKKTVIRKIRNRIKSVDNPFPPDAYSLIKLIEESGVQPDVLNPRIFDCINTAVTRTRENMTDEESANLYIKLLETANLAAHRGYFTPKQAASLQDWTTTVTKRCSKGVYIDLRSPEAMGEPVVNEEEIKEEED